MTSRQKHWLKFSLRWGIAVAGIAYVLWGITFRDRVMVLDPATGRPDYAQVFEDATEKQSVYRIARTINGVRVFEEVSAEQVWVRPDYKAVDVRNPDGSQQHLKLLAVKPSEDKEVGKVLVEDSDTKRGRIDKVLVEDPDTKRGRVVDSANVIDVGKLTVSMPRVEIGLIRMVREANRSYLLGAVFILPLCHLLTSLRWHVLLAALDIRISQARTFTINMVGAFYNAFMPGTTGGDVIKAYYAAKHARDKRTRAVISVLVDRAIGLYALIVIGGVMAFQQRNESTDCRRVATIAGVILAVSLVGLVVFYVPALRKFTGLNFILQRLPMQTQVRKAVEAMEIYGQRPLRVLWAFTLAFPVHFASILSATFAGKAFGLPLSNMYYWAVVPVIALVGAIPISPQGAGVMEFFAVQLTKREGVTISQAFALTMSIRLVQIIWNLAAGLFVLRGGYHAPTEKEAQDMETDEGLTPAPLSSEVPAGPAPSSALRPET